MSEFVRGVVRLHILHHASQEDIHGAWMSEELARHGHRISPGTLYPTLHRMESDGLLSSRQVTMGGRARRLYTITDAGRQELAEERRALAELVREVLPVADSEVAASEVADPISAAPADTENSLGARLP